MNDERDDEAEDDEGRPKNPDGLSDAAAGDVDGIGGMKAAEHDDGISADRDVFAQVRRSEKVDHIVADAGVIFRADGTEEDDDIVLRLVSDVHIAEKDDNVVVDVTLGTDTAEEADGIVDRMALRDDDVAAELHGVFFGAGRRGRKQECGGQEEGREQTLSHSAPHARLYAGAD